jgi:hypothetical protein
LAREAKVEKARGCWAWHWRRADESHCLLAIVGVGLFVLFSWKGGPCYPPTAVTSVATSNGVVVFAIFGVVVSLSLTGLGTFFWWILLLVFLDWPAFAVLGAAGSLSLEAGVSAGSGL